MVQRQRLLAYTQATAVQVRPGLLRGRYAQRKTIPANAKARYQAHWQPQASAVLEEHHEYFDLGRDRTDVMNERPREKPKRWDRNNTEMEA